MKIDFELLFKSFLRKLGSDVIVIDMQGKILFWEQGFSSTGQTSSEAIGHHLLDILPQLNAQDSEIDWELEIFTHVLQEGRDVEVRRQSRKIGNSTLWFDIFVYPLRIEDKIIGAVLVSLDISERRSLEEKLIRQARTQSLANLGASIAHEIRNPLNAMALNIQLVRESLANSKEEQNQEQTQNLEVILEEIKRLDSIVSNFLQFSRPPQTTLSLDNPNKSVETVVSLLKEQAKKKGIELNVNYGPVPNVLMDRNRIVEAIYNLTQNALQALTQGGTIKISTYVDGDHIAIQVEDDGPGIPSSMHEKIFELYFSTKEGHGTGLGLPYADSIIKSHNGSLSLESDVGQGTTFTIRLPRSIMAGKKS